MIEKLLPWFSTFSKVPKCRLFLDRLVIKKSVKASVYTSLHLKEMNILRRIDPATKESKMTNDVEYRASGWATSLWKSENDIRAWNSFCSTG